LLTVAISPGGREAPTSQLSLRSLRQQAVAISHGGCGGTQPFTNSYPLVLEIATPLSPPTPTPPSGLAMTHWGMRLPQATMWPLQWHIGVWDCHGAPAHPHHSTPRNDTLGYEIATASLPLHTTPRLAMTQTGKRLPQATMWPLPMTL